MATSSFTKNITLSKKAAERLARELKSGRVPPIPNVDFHIVTKEELREWGKNAPSK